MKHTIKLIAVATVTLQLTSCVTMMETATRPIRAMAKPLAKANKAVVTPLAKLNRAILR